MATASSAEADLPYVGQSEAGPLLPSLLATHKRGCGRGGSALGSDELEAACAPPEAHFELASWNLYCLSGGDQLVQHSIERALPPHWIAAKQGRVYNLAA